MYDKETTEWFRSHIVQQTTLCRCEKCGLYYKSSLGHIRYRCAKCGANVMS